MCQNMNDFSEIANKIYELEQEKAKQKKKVDKLEAQIKVLKDEIADYMKKRQKNRLENDFYEVLYTPYDRAQFDSKAFMENEKDGEEIYKKYCRTVTLKKITVKLAAN